MPQAGNFIVLALVVIVALSPLSEILDKTDEWSQDGSDVVRYIICLLCFLGFSLRRRGVIIMARLAASRLSVLPIVGAPRLERNHSNASSEDRSLFLTFHDLRI